MLSKCTNECVPRYDDLKKIKIVPRYDDLKKIKIQKVSLKLILW
jgi:hypothetical protein